MEEAPILFALLRLKACVSAKRFQLIDRDKNLDFLSRYEIPVSEIDLILSCLTIEDYSSGPESDRSGGSGEIWIFLYPHGAPGARQARIYVKFKLVHLGGCEYAKIISFHD